MLRQAAEELRRTAQGDVLPVEADITLPATVDRIMRTALERFGRVDVLVNNAGTSMAKAFDAVSDEDWRTDFDLKIRAAVRLVRAVIPEMRKVGAGRIINATNLAGRMPAGLTGVAINIDGGTAAVV